MRLPACFLGTVVLIWNEVKVGRGGRGSTKSTSWQIGGQVKARPWMYPVKVARQNTLLYWKYVNVVWYNPNKIVQWCPILGLHTNSFFQILIITLYKEITYPISNRSRSTTVSNKTMRLRRNSCELIMNGSRSQDPGSAAQYFVPRAVAKNGERHPQWR